MARKLDFTIHGREAWVHQSIALHTPQLYFILDGTHYELSGGLNEAGEWAHNDDSHGSEDPDEWVAQFADPHPPQYHSWKLPFQIEGEDVYINDDRLEHPNTNDCSGPIYLANGPVGRWDKRLNPGRPEWVPATHEGWWSYNTLEGILSANVLQPYHPSVSTLIPVDLNSMATVTMTAASLYESYRLPFDIEGQPAWLNNDAGMGVYEGTNPIHPWYIGNGPAQEATACLATGCWMTLGGRPVWCTRKTPDLALQRACRNACHPQLTYEEVKAMNSAAPVAPPDKRKLLEQAAGGTLWKLLVEHPLGPITKGLVLANLKVYVPEEVTDVVGHLLEHWTPPAVRPSVRRSASTPHHPTLTTTPSQRPYSIDLSGGERVSGRASYTAYRTYRTTQRFTAAELADIIEGAADRDEAVDNLREAMEEELREHDNGCEDYEYEDEEETDSDGLEMDGADFGGLLERLYADHPEYDPERDEEDEEDEDEEVPAGDTDPLQLGVYVEVTGTMSGVTFNGHRGRVCDFHLGDRNLPGVDFDNFPGSHGHNCNDNCEDGRGLYVQAQMCRVISDPSIPY